MTIQVLKTNNGFWGIQDQEKIYCCIDQKPTETNKQGFMELCSLKSASDFNIISVDDFYKTECPNLAHVKDIHKHLMKIKQFFSKLYWTNSYDFTKQILTAHTLAVIDEGISKDDIATIEKVDQYDVSDDKENKPHPMASALSWREEQEDLQVLNFLDKHIFTAYSYDFVDINTTQKKLFNDHKIQVSDHIVTYRPPLFWDITQDKKEQKLNLYHDKYACINEIHAIVISETEVITEDLFNNNGWKKISLKEFLGHTNNCKEIKYHKAYVVENTGVGSLEERQNRLSSSLQIKSFRKLVAYLQTGNVRAVPKGLYNTSKRAQKKCTIQNQSFRLKQTYDEYKDRQKEFGNKISLQEVAKHLNKPRQTVNNWLRGINVKKQINTDDLFSIAEFLGATPHWLVLGEEYPHFIPTQNNIEQEIKHFEESFNQSREGFTDNETLLKLKWQCDSQLEKQLFDFMNNHSINLKLYTNDPKILTSNRNTSDSFFQQEPTFVLNSSEIVLDNKSELQFIGNNEKVIALPCDYKANNSKYAFIKNRDSHLSPVIDVNDYILIDKNVSLETELQDNLIYGDSLDLGYFVLRLENVVINAKIEFKALEKKITLKFPNEPNLYYQAEYIDSKPFYEQDFKIPHDNRKSEPYHVEIVGKIKQVVKYF